MMGLNLHNVVRAAITSVHPDETCTLYQSLGQKNVKGVITPVYGEPQTIQANFQPDTDGLQHSEEWGSTPDSMQIYLYSYPQYPVMGGQRIPTRTGDIIKRSDDTYWLITSIDDWSQDGWCKVDAHRQTTEPDFTVSEGNDVNSGE